MQKREDASNFRLIDGIPKSSSKFCSELLEFPLSQPALKLGILESCSTFSFPYLETLEKLVRLFFSHKLPLPIFNKPCIRRPL